MLYLAQIVWLLGNHKRSPWSKKTVIMELLCWLLWQCCVVMETEQDTVQRDAPRLQDTSAKIKYINKFKYYLATGELLARSHYV